MNTPREYYRTYARIDLDAIRRNVCEAKRQIPEETGVIAVVKTNAYGHGSIAVSKAVYDLVAGYAVATVDEAMELRNAGIDKFILILGYVSPLEYETVIENDITIAIYNVDQAKEYDGVSERLGKKGKCHIKVDTGMNRIGFDAKDDETIKLSADAICEVSKLSNIDTDGIFMHFATADECDKTRARKQYDNFTSLISILSDKGVTFKHKHCSNSAAIMDMPDVTMDYVRQGITLYGLFPSDEVNKRAQMVFPAMSLVSHIGHIKEVKPGWQISYGGTFEADKDMKVATVCAGYGDGYPRMLSGKGQVLINGKRVPILGRVCMDQFMVDITGMDDIKVGDEVVLMGQGGEDAITAEEIGAVSGRFNYELVCDINRRATRVYVLDGKEFVLD